MEDPQNESGTPEVPPADEPQRPKPAETEDQLEEMQRVNPDDHCSSK